MSKLSNEKLLKTTTSHTIKDLEPLIYSVLHKTHFWSIFPSYREDFLQEGRMAIQKAIESFNEGGKVKLSTYAYVLIRNAVYDYANKMKLHYQYKTLPLNENLVENNRQIDLTAAYIVSEMRDSEYYEWLRDYFIYEDSQSTISKRYNTNQQNVSRIIVEFREYMRKELKDASWR